LKIKILYKTCKTLQLGNNIQLFHACSGNSENYWPEGQ
jgi:hypothetical protein